MSFCQNCSKICKSGDWKCFFIFKTCQAVARHKCKGPSIFKDVGKFSQFLTPTPLPSATVGITEKCPPLKRRCRHLAISILQMLLGCMGSKCSAYSETPVLQSLPRKRLKGYITQVDAVAIYARIFDHKEKNACFCITYLHSTGIPRLVRFFGPQQTALLGKPHYWKNCTNRTMTQY